jgi:predicted transglutaminase-like cysteine proteinase
MKLLAAGLLILSMISPSLADSIDSIATWHAARPRPLGLTLFCREHPEWCERLPATKPILGTKILEAVNVAVNHEIIYRRDQPVIRAVVARPGESVMVDTWEISPRYGDCEDYAVTKLARLIDAGLPRSALRLAFYRLPSGTSHTVLTAETTEGTLVLSNLSDRLLSWREIKGEWIGLERVSEYGFMGVWALKQQPK